jgi:uncharacterized protein (DUF1015 family)
MAEIKPFKGMRYQEGKVIDIFYIICPPYGVIDKRQEAKLNKRSPYNYIRIEFPHPMDKDTEKDNKYFRAAANLKDWVEKGVMAEEDEPVIYLHDHHFIYEGDEYKRRSIITAVKLEEWENRVVMPHEDTLKAPKKDRINMLWQLQSNTSSVYSLYEDKDGKIAKTLGQNDALKPVISADDGEGGHYEVRVIKDKAAINELAVCFKEKQLYIADGHHRYESALYYRNERLNCQPPIGKDHAANYVMMELVAFDDKGLLVLPPHRLVSGVSDANMKKLAGELEKYFTVKEILLDSENIWQQTEAFLKDDKMPRLVAYGLDKEKLQLLELKENAANMIPPEHSDEYKTLDVSVIDHVILEGIMGYETAQTANVEFTYEISEAVNRVKNGQSQLSFVVKPLDPEIIKKIADKNDRMPRKSTYFYPKLPSGLVLRSLKD